MQRIFLLFLLLEGFRLCSSQTNLQDGKNKPADLKLGYGKHAASSINISAFHWVMASMLRVLF
jgi:hypothetical protein